MRSSDLVGLASSVLAWAWTLVVRVLQAFLGWDPRGESCQDVRAYEVARYASLTQFSASILDTYIPRCRRLTQLHFGRIVSNPDAPQAFSENVGYNMTYNLVEPHKGNALHTHPSVEIFIALDGRWEIAWGERGEQSVVLEPYDLVACPCNVRHSYKNVEPHSAHNIMTILIAAPAITWAPAVVAEARKHGAHCTRRGVLLDFWSNGGSGQRPMPTEADDDDDDDDRAAAAEAAFHVPMSEEAMLRCVRRHASAQPLVVTTPNAYVQLRWVTVRPSAVHRACDAPEESDQLLVVLQGEVEVLEASPSSSWLGGGGGGGWVKRSTRRRSLASRLDAIRIPRGPTSRRLTLHNCSEQPCMLLEVLSEARALVDARCETWSIQGEPLATRACETIRRRVPPCPSDDSVIPMSVHGKAAK